MNSYLRCARLAVATLLAVAAIGAFEGDARALGPVDVEIGAKVGVATKPNSNAPNPFGLGVGGRAGVTIFHVYGGVSGVHYFGESVELAGGTLKASYSTTLLGVEVGYSITAIPLLTIRPQLGLGNAAFSFGEASQSHLYLEPGVTALLSLGLLYVGADLNLLAIPGVDQGNGSSTTYASFSAHGQIGITF